MSYFHKNKKNLNYRIDWVDLAKGIGILFVVIGHMNIPLQLQKIIYSFHMPLFFFISGFLYNEKKYSKNLKKILFSKIKTLIWPFLTFTLLALFFKLLSQEHIVINSFDFLEFIKGNKSLNTPLWFLTALFTTEILFSQIIRVNLNNKITIVLSVLVLAILGFINIYKFRLIGVFNIHIALIAQLFFMMGWLFKKSDYGINFLINKYLLFKIVLIFLLLLVASLSNTRLDMYEIDYGNLFLVMFSASSGIILVVLFSKLLSNYNFLKGIFKYLGKNSLIILGLHTIIAPTVVALFGQLPFRLDRVITIVIIFLSIGVINKFFPTIKRLNIKN